VNPIVVPFHCDARNTGILERLQGFNGTGEGAGEYLAGVEQVTGNQDEINLLSDGIGYYAAENTEKIFVACGFIGSSAVCFAEVNVGGMEKF
jgi:hypothetical protein